jgi:hypothetical protein
MTKIVLANTRVIILANGCAIMPFAHGERHLAIILAMVMGKPHDDLFGHVCIYRRPRCANMMIILVTISDRQSSSIQTLVCPRRLICVWYDSGSDDTDPTLRGELRK